jgi:hypothetical protein
MSGRALVDVEDRVLGSRFAPSTIMSFASLDICKCPLEYDVSLHKVNTMQKSDNYIYKQ